jgi:D-amino peptidase
MTSEVAAACEGALEAGAREILVNDAHGTARNIIASRLPREAKLARGWSYHPFGMVQHLDGTFDAAMMIGYHSRAGSDANPLAHTIASGVFRRITINDIDASELRVYAYAAASVNVPVVCVTGDAGICKDAVSLNSGIGTVAVKQGEGKSTISIHPEVAVDRIREGVKKALSGDISQCHIRMPEQFTVEIEFCDPAKSYKSSFFPGARKMGEHTIQFQSDDYFEVLRLLLFCE